MDERLGRVEQAVGALNRRLDEQNVAPFLPSASPLSVSQSSCVEREPLGALRAQGASVPTSSGSLCVRERVCRNVVASGLVSENNARDWFATFFRGCDRFVPIFDPRYDTYDSVQRRDGLLFDVLVAYGCRAAVGSLSRPYQDLHHAIRQHTSDLMLQDAGFSLEHIQALLVIASYSDSGGLLCDAALRASLQLDIPRRVTGLLSSLAADSTGPHQHSPDSVLLYANARVWYGLFVLDQILSLDGGKPPSLSLNTTSRRVRALIKHPCRTQLDLRLFAQVELNELRASSYAALLPRSTASENATQETIDGSLIDLSLWHAEWQSLVEQSIASEDERTVFTVNLRVQHAWAVLTLHLRGLTAAGVDNIALMTVAQRTLALAAKEAAERHLSLLLTNTPSVPSPGTTNDHLPQDKPYVTNFRYAMEFVWAKNAFCVLIVLRLAFLLGDPLPGIRKRLQQAREFLEELNKIGVGANISYARILSQTIKKCQRALEASVQAQDAAQGQEAFGDGDFSTFVPHEFLFEWDFPGLNLCYIPLDWQDLFLDFGTIE